MKIVNQSKNTVVAEDASVADTFWLRLKGLLGRSVIGEQQALVIKKCQQIHMCFMKFSIDVIFVDQKGTIVGLVPNIRPFRFSPTFRKASSAIEGAVGMIERSGSELGDVLEMVS